MGDETKGPSNKISINSFEPGNNETISPTTLYARSFEVEAFEWLWNCWKAAGELFKLTKEVQVTENGNKSISFALTYQSGRLKRCEIDYLVGQVYYGSDSDRNAFFKWKWKRINYEFLGFHSIYQNRFECKLLMYLKF